MRLTFIDPGMLRTEMTLEAPAAGADILGGPSEDWTPVATLFGMIEPVGAAQATAAAQDVPVISHRITIRHRTAITCGMRFAKGARRFRILTVRDPDETGRYLVCSTEELP